MSLYQQFETNSKMEVEGVWVEYGPNSKGAVTAFKVARAGGKNTAFTKYLEGKLKPYRRMIQLDTMDDKLFESIVLDAFAHCLILGWENVEDRAGNDLPYTPENCIKLMQDLPELYLDLQNQSKNISNYRNAVIEADVKN